MISSFLGDSDQIGKIVRFENGFINGFSDYLDGFKTPEYPSSNFSLNSEKVTVEIRS